MKLFKLCSLAAISALLLTSCLGDSDNTQDWYDIPAVVRYEGGKNVAYTAVYKIYASGLSSYTDGQCIWVSYRYDSGEAGDEEANGYSMVTLLETPTAINKGGFTMVPTDTTKLLPKEILIDQAVGSYQYHYLAYLEGYLFFASTFTGLTNQQNSWELSFDPNQTPTTGVDSNGNPINVYTMVVRAREQYTGIAPEKNDHNLNAYYVENTINTLNEVEKSQNKKAYGLNIKFLNKLSQDSTVLTWKNAEAPIIFSVSE